LAAICVNSRGAGILAGDGCSLVPNGENRRRKNPNSMLAKRSQLRAKRKEVARQPTKNAWLRGVDRSTEKANSSYPSSPFALQ
jgi:hypothetical protein